MTTLETILTLSLISTFFIGVWLFFGHLDDRDLIARLRRQLDRRPSVAEATDPSSTHYLGDYFRNSPRYLGDDDDYAIFQIAKAAIKWGDDLVVAEAEREARDEFLSTSEWDLSAYTGILEKSGVDEATFLRLAPKIF